MESMLATLIYSIPLQQRASIFITLEEYANIVYAVSENDNKMNENKLR